MTTPISMPNDNGGRCEGCNRPETIGQPQTLVDVVLADGRGGKVDGTMFLCAECRQKRAERKQEGR